MGFLTTIFFAIFDYVGFNKIKGDLTIFGFKTTKYRVIQTVLQFGILIPILYIVFGWREALIFFILWWTWVADFMYYGLCELNKRYWFNLPGPGAWKREQNIVTWATWTPWGLLFMAIFKIRKVLWNRVVPAEILYFQAFQGIGLALILEYLI